MIDRDNPERDVVRVSDTALVNGRLGETAGVWATADIVIVEIDDGRGCIDTHLTPAAAREFARHIVSMADLAETYAAEEMGR